MIPGAVARWWERLWFQRGPAVNLAAARIIFAGHALWVHLSRDLPALSGWPGPFWSGVAGVDRLRFFLAPGHPAVENAAWWAAAAALLCALLGVLPRLSCFLAALLLYHLAPLETIFWTPDPFERGLTISVLALVVLSASRCGDALTVTRRLRGGGAPPADSWRYTWPLRLVQLFVAQVYFFAGWSKIVRAGPAWMTAENIRRWILVPSQQDQLGLFHGAGPWIAERPWLCLFIGVATVVLDLAFISVPFSAAARRVLVPLAAAGHAGILVAMNIFFINLPQLLVFVNWEAAARRAAPRPSGPPASPGLRGGRGPGPDSPG